MRLSTGYLKLREWIKMKDQPLSKKVFDLLSRPFGYRVMKDTYIRKEQRTLPISLGPKTQKIYKRDLVYIYCTREDREIARAVAKAAGIDMKDLIHILLDPPKQGEAGNIPDIVAQLGKIFDDAKRQSENKKLDEFKDLIDFFAPGEKGDEKDVH
jgi:hypothetical protein